MADGVALLSPVEPFNRPISDSDVCVSTYLWPNPVRRRGQPDLRGVGRILMRRIPDLRSAQFRPSSRATAAWLTQLGLSWGMTGYKRRYVIFSCLGRRGGILRGWELKNGDNIVPSWASLPH